MTGPVLITGCAGSGITMLQLLLQNFPDVHGSHEEVWPYDVVGSKDGNRVVRYPWRIGEKIHLQHLVNFGFRVVVIIRDGRDLMVSKRRLGSGEYFIKQRNQWARAVGEYLPAIERFKSVCMMKYEDLVAHPGRELLNLGAFLGFSYPGESISLVMMPKAETMASAIINNRTSIQSDLVGRWKLSEHRARIRWLLADNAIRESTCRMLVRFGYEKDDSWIDDFRMNDFRVEEYMEEYVA